MKKEKETYFCPSSVRSSSVRRPYARPSVRPSVVVVVVVVVVFRRGLSVPPSSVRANFSSDAFGMDWMSDKDGVAVQNAYRCLKKCVYLLSLKKCEMLLSAQSTRTPGCDYWLFPFK